MSTAEAKTGAKPTSADAADAAAAQQTGTKPPDTKTDYVPFAAAGRTFTKWLNVQLARTNNPTITLGTKTATVIMLRDDGALAVDVDGPDVKAERQSVALAPEHLDELMPQFRKPGV